MADVGTRGRRTCRGGRPRVFQERAPRAFRDGFATAAARYGLPIDHLEVRFVNDHCYARMRPVGAPEPKPGRPSSPPPPLVLKVLSRLHPKLRRRARTARREIEQKLWHEDRLRWEQHERDTMRARAQGLQAEPIEELDDAALIDHVRRAAAHLERGIACHLSLIPVYNVPLGRLLLACRSFAVLSTVEPDGRPHSTVVSTKRDVDVIVFALPKNRRKTTNMARDPRVAVVVFDAANPFESAQVQGTAKIEDDPDGLLVEELSHT